MYRIQCVVYTILLQCCLLLQPAYGLCTNRSLWIYWCVIKCIVYASLLRYVAKYVRCLCCSCIECKQHLSGHLHPICWLAIIIVVLINQKAYILLITKHHPTRQLVYDNVIIHYLLLLSKCMRHLHYTYVCLVYKYSKVFPVV